MYKHLITKEAYWVLSCFRLHLKVSNKKRNFPEIALEKTELVTELAVYLFSPCNRARI